MVNWYVNPGLQPLITEMKLEYPGLVVGTIGDAAHQAERSDHNPNQYGRVNAADFMIDEKFTPIMAHSFSRLVISDSRVHYVIWNEYIWTSETRIWNNYNGSDPHTNHVHVSVKDSAYTNTSPWDIGDDVLTDADKEDIANRVLNKLLTYRFESPYKKGEFHLLGDMLEYADSKADVQNVSDKVDQVIALLDK